MHVARSSVTLMLVAMLALGSPLQAQRTTHVSASAVDATAVVASPTLLARALSVGARTWAETPLEPRDASLADRQASGASKPFWTRTKLLILGGAVIVLGAIIVSEMRKTCREQGPRCFD